MSELRRHQKKTLLSKPTFWRGDVNMVVHFCASHLLMSYCFFGVVQKAHAAPSKQAILGFYNNLSIIDIRTTLVHLRYCLSFFMSIFSTSPSKCLLVDSGEKGELFHKELFSRLNVFKHDFVLGLWRPGVMRQYASVYARKMIGSCGRLTYGMPRVVLTASMDLSRLHDLNMECRRFGLIQLVFVDTDVDITRFNYWVPLNLKNVQSQIFFYDLLLEVYKRSAYKIRHKFLHVGVLKSRDVLSVATKQRRLGLNKHLDHKKAPSVKNFHTA